MRSCAMINDSFMPGIARSDNVIGYIPYQGIEALWILLSVMVGSMVMHVRF